MDPILVISSCTGEKAVDPPGALTLRDLADSATRARRETALRLFLRPAAEMYTGQQHLHVMQGLKRIRARYGKPAVGIRIVSAGYGVVDEHQLLAPYNVTFNDMRRPAAREWAKRLNIANDVRSCLPSYPLVIVLLGERYPEAIAPPVAAGRGQRLIFLTKVGLRDQLTGPRVTLVDAGKAEVSRYGAGTIALKGKMFDLFAAGLVTDPRVWEEVMSDDSPKAFVSAMAKGRRAV